MSKSLTYNEDCLAAMMKMDSNTFDLAIVDPPYGINAPKMQMGNRSGCVSTAVRLGKGRLNSGSGKLKNRLLNQSIVEWDSDVPSKEYFDELFRVSQNQIIWGGNYFELPPSRCWICWDKLQPWDNFSQFELAWTSFDKPTKMYRVANTGGANREKKIHPTQKPVKLYDMCLRDFSVPGMEVLDTHLGSGSSRISSSKAMVNFTGFEINSSYFLDQEERFRKFKNQLRLAI